MKVSFVTTIRKDDVKDATGIQVPSDVIEQLNSGKKPKVVISLNGYSYRSTVAAYSGVFLIPLAKEHREAANVQAGDTLEITLALDTEPRVVEIPEDLASALDAKDGAKEAFDQLNYSTRKEHVRNITASKTDETRQRRIAKVVEMLGSH